MGVSWTGGGIEGLFDGLLKQGNDLAHEAAAEVVAQKARGLNLQTANEIQISATTDSPEITLDIERVRARANEILSGG